MIYFVGTKRTGGPVRVFYARKRDFPAAMAQMDEGNPECLYLLGTMRGGKLTEWALHRRYRAHRIRADWFDGQLPLDNVRRTK
jgi:hypothetical protein